MKSKVIGALMELVNGLEDDINNKDHDIFETKDDDIVIWKRGYGGAKYKAATINLNAIYGLPLFDLLFVNDKDKEKKDEQ